MKNKILILALNHKFKKNIAQNLSKQLDMFYLDVFDLIKYELINIDEVIKKAGLEYYNKQETKIIKSLANFENIVVTMDNDSFFNKKNYEYLKNSSLFIYLKLSYSYFISLIKQEDVDSKYELMIDQKLFDERDKILQSICDITININKRNKNIEEKIIKEIKKYYKDVL